MMLAKIWRLGWPAFRYLRGIDPHWNALASIEEMSEEQRRTEIGRRLLAQVQYFGRRADALPEWRSASEIDSVEELWEAWPSLPILTKEDLRNRFHPERLRELPGVTGAVSSTGGSTGEPTPYLHDQAMLTAKWSATFYYRWQLGWRPWIPLVIVWGSERDIGKRRNLRGRARDWLQMHHLVDGYRMSEEVAHDVRSIITRNRPVAVYGFTSMLDFVARSLLESGLALAPGSVITAWNGGEMLFEDQAQRFERAFGAPLLNYYGGRELSAMAYQCEKGQGLKVLRPLLFVEIVDENGRPVKPGQVGRMVWTSTVCRGTPFLRYDVGDLGSYERSDEDAAGIRSLSMLFGRTAGLIPLPDGRQLNCLFWNHLFKEFEAVRQFQVVYRSADRSVHLRLKGPGFAGDDQARLHATLGPLFGDDGVSFEWVDSIPLTAEGKLEQVVRQ